MSTATKSKKQGNQSMSNGNGSTALIVTEEQKRFLPPSILQAQTVAELDEAGAAFLAEAKDVGLESNEPAGIPISRIDHETGLFTINGEPAEFLEGYPVHFFQTRAWWEKSYKSGENKPPDCSSPDGITPLANSPKKQADVCFECPMAQWGSAGNGQDGQACSTNVLLFLVNPSYGFPPVTCLILPPSSIKAIMGGPRSPGYLSRAKVFKNPRTGKPAAAYQIVWTRFSLLSGGDRHYVLCPEPVTVAPAEEARHLAGLIKQFHDGMETLRGQLPVTRESGNEIPA